MYYIKWTNKDINNLPFFELFTEVEAGGTVLRELGFNEKGEVVHRAPSTKTNYGVFDNQVVEITNLTNSISSEKFEELWLR